MRPTLMLAVTKFLLEEASRSRNSLRAEWTARKTRWLCLCDSGLGMMSILAWKSLALGEV